MKRLYYISRALSKIQHKKYELYVLSRIIHKLDNPQIRYVFQQYATRNEDTGQYALIDLYLPQLGIAIEVDEPHHKEQYTEDQIRQKEIEELNIEVKRIICYDDTIENVNKQIDDLVQTIENSVKKLGDAFQPWEGLNGYDYYAKKGYFDVNDDTELSSPTEICNCFGFKHACQRGARKLNSRSNTLIWWPHENYAVGDKMIDEKSIWYNKLEDEETIVEYDLRLNGDDEIDKFCNKEINVERERIVFYRKHNMFNDKLYRFVGVFKIDIDETRKKKKRVYKRIATEININELK